MTDDEALIPTREALHALAEHVLAAARHAATGRIGLRPAPGGVATPPFPSPAGDRVIRVDGNELVVEDDDGVRRTAISTLRAAGAFVGIAPGAPAEVYRPATPLDLDAPLAVDPTAARRLADWYLLTEAALEQLRAELAADAPSAVQLWPEHLDLAMAAAEVNYGGSPGDAAHPLPYLYIGPFRPPAPDGGFWNEPFGSSCPATAIDGVDDAVAYFRRGRERLGRLASGALDG